MNSAQTILQMMFDSVANSTQQMLATSNTSDIQNSEFKKMLEDKSEEYSSLQSTSEDSESSSVLNDANKPNDKVDSDTKPNANNNQQEKPEETLQDDSQIQMIDLSLVIPQQTTLSLTPLTGEKLNEALAQKIIPQNAQEQQAVLTNAKTEQPLQQTAQTTTQNASQGEAPLQQVQNELLQNGENQSGTGAKSGENAKEGEVLQLTTTDTVQNSVFEDAKFVPVKVGEGQMQTPTQAATTDINIANTIINASANGTEQVTIKLTPDNLGNLVIDIMKSPTGAISIVLSTETEAAAKMLNEHSANIASLLNNGNNEVKIQVVPPQESESMMQNPNKDAKDGTDNKQQQQKDEKQNTDDFLNKLRLGLFDTNVQSA